MLYHSYIGDGCLSDRMQLNKRKNAKYRILRASIATNCFDIPSLKHFFDKLDIAYSICKTDHNITFNGRNARSFLEYIGPCHTPEYQYKWNIKDNEFGPQLYNKNISTITLVQGLTAIASGKLTKKEMIEIALQSLRESGVINLRVDH